jgi:hypothetical protein
MVRASCLLFFLFSCSPAHAELYQWTDAQGQTHFSDKKPAAANSKTVDIRDSGAMRNFETKTAQPVTLSIYGSTRLLLVKPVQLALDNAGKANPVIGSYHFGPDCVSPSSMTLNEWRQRYVEADPRPAGYSDEIVGELGRHGLSSLNWQNNFSLQPTNVMLDASITDMQLLTCATKTKLDGKYQYYEFRRSAARLVVKWTFRSAIDQKVIYEASTVGVANPPNAQIQYLMNAALKQAMNDAVLHLLEDISILEIMRLPAGADPEQPIEGDWLDKVTQLPKAMYDRYVKTATLTEILTLLVPIKNVVSEYYMSEGDWPTSLEQMQLSSMSEAGKIASVSLRGRGEIVADISPAFGPGTLLILIPSSAGSGGTIQWSCAATLNSPILQQWLMDTCGH